MNEETKAEVLEAVVKWRPRLRLMDWSISYEWDAKLDDDAAMACLTKQRYRRVTLRIGSDAKDYSWQTIEKQVLHELCHCLTAEMHDTADAVVSATAPGKIAYDVAGAMMDKANERLTEWVARVVYEAYEGTDWDAEPPLRSS